MHWQRRRAVLQHFENVRSFVLTICIIFYVEVFVYWFFYFLIFIYFYFILFYLNVFVYNMFVQEQSSSRDLHTYLFSVLVHKVYCFVFRYGDIAPKSFRGRLFAVIWMIIGCIALTLFNAQLTAMITSNEIPTEINLIGQTVSHCWK